MKIKFCGAAETTTGSRHLLLVNGMKILLDCGMYQGKRHESYEKNKHFDYFDPKDIDMVLLSHAHIDHSGSLPNLVKNGFSGSIISTYATRDLCQIMLLDSARIQAHDAEYLNKHAKEGDPTITPIYSEEDAQAAMKLFVAIGYNRSFKLGKGIYLRFYDAGHILGSAQVVLDIDDEEDGQHKRLLFTGDVGRGKNDLLPDPDPVSDVDIMITESTYGGREHESPPKDDEDKFCALIKKSLERGGKVFIPSFAVERTQQLLFILHKLFKDKKLEPCKVFVDSPMAVSATEIFRIHPECFNEDMNKFLLETKDPFDFDTLRMVRPLSQSKEINNIPPPAIILAASGMCEAGRILYHLKNNIENPHNTILFVGYCATYTLGWKIRTGWTNVNILGNSYRVNAAIEHFDALSGHADNSELIDYFKATKGKKSTVIIVHGEKERGIALEKELQAFHSGQFYRPSLGDEITV